MTTNERKPFETIGSIALKELDEFRRQLNLQREDQVNLFADTMEPLIKELDEMANRNNKENVINDIQSIISNLLGRNSRLHAIKENIKMHKNLEYDMRDIVDELTDLYGYVKRASEDLVKNYNIKYNPNH